MRYFKVILLLFMVVVIASGPARAADKLVIISPHWEGIRTEFTRGFGKWYAANRGGDVEITWLDQGGTSDDLRFIKSGFSRSPEGIDVDIFYGGGIDPYIELSKDSLLQPYKLPDKIIGTIPKDLNGIPLYDSEYRWYGSSLAGFGILYNKKLLKMYGLETPQSWVDLADPDFYELVGSSDPRHSGSTHIMYELILQAYGWERGWEIILATGANVRNFPKSSGQISKDLAVGETAVALSIDTYAFSAIEDLGPKRLGFVLPQQATVITPDPIAMLKGAPNKKVAEAYIEFTMSPAGQKIWLYKKGVPGGPVDVSLNKMCVLPSLYKDYAGKSNVTVNPFAQKKGFTYDFEKGSKRWGLLNDLIGAYVIDTHKDLAAAWEKVSKNKKKRAALLAPPITEEDAMSLAGEKWSDAVVKNEYINKWLNEARKRYRK